MGPAVVTVVITFVDDSSPFLDPHPTAADSVSMALCASDAAWLRRRLSSLLLS